MKLNEFIKAYQEARVIDSSTFALIGQKPKDLRRQVRDWVKKGYLLPLKRGKYIFSEEYRRLEASGLFIANFLVSPSYLSLEFALGYYGLIPEKVTVFTSVTTKKTAVFRNPLGVFEYRCVKKELFFGYTKGSDVGQEFFIAFPEKALLDYFYLNRQLQGSFDEFDSSLRLQNLEGLNLKQFKRFRDSYDKKTKSIADNLITYIKSGKRKLRTLK